MLRGLLAALAAAFGLGSSAFDIKFVEDADVQVLDYSFKLVIEFINPLFLLSNRLC